MTDQVSSLTIRISSEDAQRAVDALRELGIQAETTETQVNNLNQTTTESNARAGRSYADVRQLHDRFLDSLQREATLFNATREQAALYDATFRNLTDAEVNYAQHLGRTIDVLREEREARNASIQAERAETLAVERYIQSLQKQADLIGKTTAEKLLYNLASKGANAAQLEEASATIALIAAHEAETVAKKAATAATNEFSVANSGSIREIIVLAREMSRGDFSRFGGSLSILAQRSGLLAIALSPVGLVVTGVAVALGTLGTAAAVGATESQNFYKAMILSGNAAGLTFSSITDLSKSIGGIGVTQHQASEALTALAQSGAVAGANMEKLGLATVEANRVIGQSVEQSVEIFTQLGNAPVTASEKLNESLHYLTKSTYDQIKAFQDQGRDAEAAAAAQNAYADAMINRSADIETHLGSLQKAWLGIKDAAAKAWEAMLNVGREQTLDQKIDDANTAVRNAQERLNGGGTTGQKGFANRGANYAGNDQGKQLQDDLNAATNARDSLVEQRQLLDRVADGQRVVNDQVAAHIKFQGIVNKNLSDEERMNQEIDKAKNTGTAAGEKQSDIDEQVKRIRESYAKKPTGQVTAKDILGFDVQQVKNQFNQIETIYKEAEGVNKAYFAAGQLDAKEYYDARIALIRLEADAQVKEQQGIIAANEKAKKDPTATDKSREQNSKNISKAEQDIADVREKEKGQLLDLTTAETARTIKIQQGYKDASLAADQFIAKLQRQQKQQADSYGVGDETRKQNAGIDAINERYTAELQALEKFKADKAALTQSGNLNAEDQQQYDNRLAIINKEQAAELLTFTETYRQKKELDSNYYLGALDALQNYLDKVADHGKAAQEVVAKGLTGFDDAVTSAIFGDGGKGFKNLGKSIAQEIVKGIVSQTITAPIAQWFKDQLGGGSGGGSSSGGIFSIIGNLLGFGGGGAVGDASVASGAELAANGFAGAATGGGVQNSVKRIGEEGPEIIQTGGKQYLAAGEQAATVIPTASSGGMGGGVTIDQSNSTYNTGAGVSRAEMVAAQNQSSANTIAKVRRLMATGKLGSNR